MVTTVRAIYENGKIRLLDEVQLEEGQELEVRISEMPPKIGKRIANLHPGAFVFASDFDEPLPDSFWFGADE